MLYPPGFYFVKIHKRFVILSSDKSLERNLSCFFDIKKPRRMEHLQSEEPFSSDPYFSMKNVSDIFQRSVLYRSNLLLSVAGRKIHILCTTYIVESQVFRQC